MYFILYSNFKSVGIDQNNPQTPEYSTELTWRDNYQNAISISNKAYFFILISLKSVKNIRALKRHYLYFFVCLFSSLQYLHTQKINNINF